MPLTLGGVSIAGLLASLIGGDDLDKKLEMTPVFLFFLALPLLFGLLWAFFGIGCKARHQAVIIRSRRSDRVSFWRRKQDDLLLALVTAGLGPFVGYVFGRGR